MSMTNDEIKKAQAICNEATPGPWKYDSDGDVWTESEFENDPKLEEFLGSRVYKSIGSTAVFRARDSNQKFIAFARTALPKALAALAEYQKAWDDIFAACNNYKQLCETKKTEICRLKAALEEIANSDTFFGVRDRARAALSDGKKNE